MPFPGSFLIYADDRTILIYSFFAERRFAVVVRLSRIPVAEVEPAQFLAFVDPPPIVVLCDVNQPHVQSSGSLARVSGLLSHKGGEMLNKKVVLAPSIDCCQMSALFPSQCFGFFKVHQASGDCVGVAFIVADVG